MMCHLIWYFCIKQGRNGHSADVFEWLIEQLMTLIKWKTLSRVNLQGASVRKKKNEKQNRRFRSTGGYNW